MLNTNIRSLDNTEPEISNTLPCLSDRWLNQEEKENPERSSSSSGSSSVSDLKRRLQDLPSRNAPVSLASRAINTSRRLSRKRDLYFYSATNRIEENDEKEEQESLQAKRSVASRNSAARTRRRAKLRAEAMHTQIIDNEAPPVAEVPETESQQPIPLSRTPSALSTHSNQLHVTNDSSRSQTSPSLLRIFSKTSSLCSSPPSKFGGYRPNAGVILYNLSSSSEQGSDYENLTDRIGFPAKIQSRSDSSSRAVSDSLKVLSSLDELGVATPIPRMSLNQLMSPSVKDEDRRSFYRDKGTAKSDSCSVLDNVDGTTDQQQFLSARENTHYRMQTMEPLFGISRDTSAEVSSYDGRDRYVEESLQSCQKVQSLKECLDNLSPPNLAINADQKSISGGLSFDEDSAKSLEYQMKKTPSKCSLEPSEIKPVRIPLSTSRIHDRTEKMFSPQFRACSSEGHSATSSLQEFFNDELKRREIAPTRLSMKSQDSQQEYVTVPSLALNSQEMTSSASSQGKTPGKHLNASDLINALSSVSLLQKESTYRLSGGTSSRKIETGIAGRTSAKFDENSEMCTSPRFRSATSNLPKSVIQVALNPDSTESDRQSYVQNVITSDLESPESNRLLQSDKESSMVNFENAANKTSSRSLRRIGLEKDVNSTVIKNYSGDSGEAGNYETSDSPKRFSSFFQVRMDEPLELKSHAVDEDLDEDSEDSETPRSESKRMDRYATSDCYETRESPSGEPEDSDNFPTKMEAIETMSYQENHLHSPYEGEVYEQLNEKTKLNQVGDGQNVEESIKFEFPDSSEDEDQEDKAIESKARVSLEQMAAEQFRRTIFGEQARATQSDTVSYFTEKFYDASTFVQSASTSKLPCSRDSSRFRRKSQDRFPFTMSEKSSVSSHKHPGRLESVNEETKSMENTYKLELHPSIMRLAREGFEDTPAEIIDYVSFNEERQPRSRMRKLMKKFSARWKRSMKPDEAFDARTTDVLYENRDYQGDSAVDSCSESSLLKDLKTYSPHSNPIATKESPDEQSSVVTEKKSIARNESSRDTLASATSSRRHDRDNLWVQEIKSPESNHGDEIKITETPKRSDERSKKDPYSVFFVKSTQQTPDASARGFLPEEESKGGLSSGKKNKVQFRGSALTVVSKKSDGSQLLVPRKSIVKEPINRRIFENREQEVDTSCLCLRFYRMIIPRYRSWRWKFSRSPSAKQRPRFSPRKRKG